MAEVKKPQRAVKAVPEVPEIKPEDPKDVRFLVGDKEYKLPRLTFKQYKAYLKKLDEVSTKENMEDMTELEALEASKQLYFELLSPEYPDLEIDELDDMPLDQYGAEFMMKVKVALFRTPLAS